MVDSSENVRSFLYNRKDDENIRTVVYELQYREQYRFFDHDPCTLLFEVFNLFFKYVNTPADFMISSERAGSGLQYKIIFGICRTCGSGLKMRLNVGKLSKNRYIFEKCEKISIIYRFFGNLPIFNRCFSALPQVGKIRK